MRLSTNIIFTYDMHKTILALIDLAHVRTLLQ